MQIASRARVEEYGRRDIQIKAPSLPGLRKPYVPKLGSFLTSVTISICLIIVLVRPIGSERVKEWVQ